MTGFFQSLIHGLQSFLTVIAVTATSVLLSHGKPTITQTPTVHMVNVASPSATSIPEKQVKGIKTSRIIAPTSFDGRVYAPPTQAVDNTNNRQTYLILALSQLTNMNGANSQAVSAAYDAYNTFLQTPNLEYMTPAQQQNIFTPILTSVIQKLANQRLDQLHQQENSLQQQLNSLPTVTPAQYYQPSQSTQTSSMQTCINNKIATINNNPFLNESQREAEVANAPQACANQQ